MLNSQDAGSPRICACRGASHFSVGGYRGSVFVTTRLSAGAAAFAVCDILPAQLAAPETPAPAPKEVMREW
jgi:hypothetical protein